LSFACVNAPLATTRRNAGSTHAGKNKIQRHFIRKYGM
jgi:hypothetical protein